ncbi:four helix bundle protein [Sunxiuqinia rutila]|uniref:four helix bundle protein n=1 Tax=Sunxiuqinia rutila TaxID=1397841 RepID=UPI003D36AE4E
MDRKTLEARTKVFAHNCVKTALSLEGTKLGNHICGQLIRCATSVPANYRAANLAHSRAAFAAKLSIVIEEADECGFWLDFAIGENILSTAVAEPLIKEAHELTSIFVASRKSIQVKSKIINQK